MTSKKPLLALLLLLASSACGRGEAREGTPPPAAPVDSARATREALARFRAETPGTAAELGGAFATDRDTLVARVVRALERADTLAFEPMAVNRAEFAYLYYESNPQSRPPYELPPELMWMQMLEHNRKGVLRALDRFGGKPLGLRGYACEGEERQGENRVFTGCILRLRPEGGDTVSIRLFGAIIERGGRYKVLSYANDL